MKKIKLFLASFAFLTLTAWALVPTTTVSAAGVVDEACSASTSGSADNPLCDGNTQDANSLIKVLVNTLLFLVGALSVVMIIWGGISYTISNGDSAQIKRAKDTIMYAVIGLIVSILAYAIVNWILKIF